MIANELQLEREYSGFRFVAKSALAGLLALLLLSASATAISPAHGQTHHSDRSSDQCLFCAFAHGQVMATEAQTVLAVSGVVLVAFLLPAVLAAFGASDYWLSPSRAPPVFIVLQIG